MDFLDIRLRLAEERTNKKDVNKNSFAYGQREGDGKCEYKGLFIGLAVL